MGVGMYTFLVAVITALLVWSVSTWLGVLALLTGVVGSWAGGSFGFLTDRMGFSNDEASKTPSGMVLGGCWIVLFALTLFALFDWLK